MTNIAKRPILKWVLSVLAVLVLALAVLITNLVWFRPVVINAFYERVFIELALEQPEILSMLRIAEQFGYYAHNEQLTDPSDQAALAQLQSTQDNLDILRSYDRDGQSPQQVLSTDILDWYMQDIINTGEYLYHSYPVNQMFGVQSGLPSFMSDIHQVNTARDAQQYLVRLNKFEWKFDLVIESLQTRELKGVLPPTFVVDRVLTEMRNFINKPAQEHLLFTSFKHKLDKIEDLNTAQREEFLQQAKIEIETAVYPAYNSLIAYFVKLKPATNSDDGAWKHPDGDAYYAAQLRHHTTTDKTPEQVHNIGLSEVARIQGEMRGILDGLGHSGDTVAVWMDRLAKQERFLFANTDEGKEQSLAGYRDIIRDANQRMAPIFNKTPAAGVEVERIPSFKEKTSASHYNPPAMDGSRPGVFFAKLYDMNEVPKFGMKTLAYHEAVPGHHFQIALQQEITGVPTFRKILPFTAYTEGWALYAEYLVAEYGLHDDPYTDLGRLRSELFRAVRLVVDTGIHYKRWTRQQAITYMVDNTGMSKSGVTSEIERYIVMPGQACAYKIGQLKILELREKAKQALAGKFDIRDFHDVVLQNGAVPLEILERVVDAYIDQRS